MAKNSKKLQKQLRGLLGCATCALALATTVSLAGPAFADVPTSTNLPVANFINGATVQYNNGVTAQTNLGGLVTNQVAEKAAADTGKKLNVDVGTTSGHVADIGYNSFNLAKNTNVNFNFGASDQVALNRVTPVGGSYASKIFGSITQTGAGSNSSTVFLINPNGILFGANSSVSLNSFVASTFKVQDNDLNDLDRTIKLKRSGAPAGIYFEGPGNIAVSNSAVFASNAILNKDKNFQANNNLAFITGDDVKLDVFSGGIVGFPLDDVTGHDYVSPTTSTASTITLPNNVTVQLGEITSKAGKLTTPNLTVIAKMNKDLQTQYKDIVNIGSVINAGNVFMYANNAMNDATTNGNLNINTSAIKSTNLYGDIEITADGKINVNGDLYTKYGHVLLGTNNLFNGFGPTEEQSENMAEDYRLEGLIGDSITTGNISAGDLIAIGKSITTKNITTKGSAILAGVDTLTVNVDNTVYPFGIDLTFKGGAVTTRDITTGSDLVVLGSTITAGKIESQGPVVIAAINSLHLNLASDLSNIDLCVSGGTVNINTIETEPPTIVNTDSVTSDSPIVVFGNTLNVKYVESETGSTAALIAINNLHFDADIDPTIFNVDISPFMTGNFVPQQIETLATIPTNSIVPLVQPVFTSSAPQYVDADLSFTGGTITSKTVQADNVVLLGSTITADSVVADDLAVILGIKAADFHLDAGQYLPYTVNFESHITGGTINVSDILSENLDSDLTAIELGASITNDNVEAETFAALGINTAELEFQFTDGNQFNFTQLPEAIVSLVDNNTANQGYLFASLTANNGTVNVNSIIADNAILLGSKITTGYLDVDHLLKTQLPSIDISYNPQDEYEY